jgi:hypothetical protein
VLSTSTAQAQGVGDGVRGGHRAPSLPFDRLMRQPLCRLHQDALNLLWRARGVRFEHLRDDGRGEVGPVHVLVAARFGIVAGGHAGVAQHPVFGLRQIRVRIKARIEKGNRYPAPGKTFVRLHA